MKKIFRLLGPGIITAALIFGPGSLTITSKLGSAFGYRLLWIVIIATFFMIIFTVISARTGLEINESLIRVIRTKYGKFLSYLVGISIALVTISFQTGNAIGAGLAAAGLFENPTAPWIIFFSLTAIILLFFRSFYSILEKLMIFLVILMVLSFMVTLIISSPAIPAVLAGFIPAIPSGSEFLSIALIASSFSLVGAFYQAYLVREKGWEFGKENLATRESITGILILGFISMIVLMTAGSVLNTSGIEVRSAADMGRALEPLFGHLAYFIFMLGLFAASFSSLVGNATLGGTILADTFLLGDKLSNWPVRILIMVIITIGAFIAVVFRRFGIQLIIIAQSVTIIIAPLFGIMLYIIAMKPVTERIHADRKKKESVILTPFLKISGIVGLLLLIFLVMANIYLLFK